MNLYLRLLLIWLRNRRSGVAHHQHVARTAFRVLPNDIDMFGHMNNGRYLQIMDVARVDWMLQTGIANQIRQHRWAPLLGGGAVRFRHSLRLFQRYEVLTRLLGWDDRWFYIEHTFVDRRGRRIAVGITRAGLREKNGWVAAQQVADAVETNAISPTLPAHVMDWAAFENAICRHSTTVLTEKPMPSVQSASGS
ncbi:MAG: thioesterase family protein [Pseudomonadota bacterium]